MSVRSLGTAALLAAVLFAARLPARAADDTAPRGKMVLRPYQMAELVVPVCGAASAPGKAEKPEKTLEDELVKLIQNTVAPKTWASMGGQGTIDYFPMTMTLVINQTPDVHEQIADMLTALRRLQDTEVALEVRLLTVPEGFVERLGIDFNDNAPASRCEKAPAPGGKETDPQATDGLTFLNDKQVVQFLEAVQGNSRTCVMQAPKVTMFNGQAANVNVTDKQCFVTGAEVVQRDGQPVIIPKTEDVVTGFRMSVLPVVSADRRFVQVGLKIDQTDLASTVVPLFPVTVQLKNDQGKAVPFTQFIQQPRVNTLGIEKTLTIPDGGTVLLGGLKKVSEGRSEFGPPVLSKVPYVNRLFKNVGYASESQMVYVLVTPRVIVNEEEEQHPAGCGDCKHAPVCTRPPQAGATEESAWVPAKTEAPAARRPTKVMAELLKAYEEACAAGRTDEAAKLAQAALTLDPTCFAKGRKQH
jgi:general secretion pathway protein D